MIVSPSQDGFRWLFTVVVEKGSRETMGQMEMGWISGNEGRGTRGNTKA